MNNIVVTVSILISNNYDRVKRCLESVQPLLDQVPSELILTDTGCNPELRCLLEEYTDHIIDFTWCQDFSAARNVGLNEARGEWFLYIDDDEWFEDVSPLLQFFSSDECSKTNVAFYIQRNHLDYSGNNYSDHYVDRLIRIQDGLHFEHRVHEAYTGIEIGTKVLIPCIANHYGYIYADEEERMAKHLRNQKLLELECAEHPDDMRMRNQLVTNQYEIGDWDGAMKYAFEGIEMNPQSNSEYWDACHTSILYCLKRKEAWGELLSFGKQFLKKKLYPLDSFGTLQYMIEADYHLHRFDELCVLADIALDLYNDYKANPDIFNPNQLMRQDFIDDGSICDMTRRIVVAVAASGNEALLGKLISSPLGNMARGFIGDEVWLAGELEHVHRSV